MTPALIALALILGGIAGDRFRLARTAGGRHRGAGRARRTALNPPLHTSSIAHGTVRIPVGGQ